MSGRKPPGDAGRGLSEDERELWTGITRSIKPLRRRAARSPTERSERDAKVSSHRSPSAVASEKPSRPEVRAAPPLAPVSRRTKQKLARGTEAIDDRVDLHGMTQVEAHGALLQFLRNAQHRGAKFVLVITGKGRARLASPREAGVLRREVPRWLKLPEFRDYVVGVESAHARHGGDGALYVRLRRARES